MAKKESTLLNMVLTLFLVTLVASTVLGFVNKVTKEPIRQSRLAKKNNAIKAVVPDFDNEPSNAKETVKSADGLGELTFYTAKKDDKVVGTAVETYTLSGFSGRFDLMVGFLPDGTINQVAVLSHKETPGLGDKMERSKADWSKQFDEVNPAEFALKVKKDGGNVDAITASTISSRAYCDAVQRAYDTYMKEKGGTK